MIAAGFGFRTGATAASLRAALALAQHDCPPVTALAAPQDKTALLAMLADALHLPVIGLAPAALRDTTTPTQSPPSITARGTGSVAEAAALAAVGAGGRLLTTRHISPDRMASCAIAEGPIA